MNLGTNIKYQMQTVFEAAFDEKSAKQVEKMYDQMSKRVADSTRAEFVEAFKSFGQVLNDALTKLEIQPIDISKMIELPNAQMFSQLGSEFGARFAEGFGGAIAGGVGISNAVQNELKESLARLKAEKENLNKEYVKTQSQLSGYVSNKSSMTKLRDFDGDAVDPLQVDGNAIEEAKKMYTEFTKIALKLRTIGKEQGVESSEYLQTLYTAREAYRDLFRMQKTLKGLGTPIPNNVKSAFGLYDYEQQIRYEESMANAGKKPTLPFIELPQAAFVEDSWDRFLNSIQQGESKLLDIENQIANIDAQIDSIVQKIQAANGTENGFLSGVKDELKTLNEIEEAYNRIWNSKTKKLRPAGKAIDEALNADPTTYGKELKALYQSYINLPDDSPWETQYAALLKFMKLYESYITSTNTKHRNMVSDPNSEYSKLYNQFKPMVGDVETGNVANMLRNVINLSGAEKEAVDVERIAEAETKARMEAEAKAKAEKDAAEATRLAAEAAEKERLAQEASTKESRMAAENTKLTAALKEQMVASYRQEADVLEGKTDVKESMRLVGSDGILSTVQGQDYTIDASTMVKQLVANLRNSIIMSLHDHPNSMDAFTPADIDSFAKLYYDQGAKINGIIANGVIQTIDFTGISKEMAIKIGQSFSANLSRIAQETGMFSFENGNLIPTDEINSLAQSDPDRYMEIMDNAINGINVALDDAFKQNGLESTVKRFTTKELPELSRYLLEVQQNGESAVAPVEKLKNLIMTMKPSQSFNWDNYTDIFGQFEKGSIDGFDAINQINSKLNKDTNAQARRSELAAQMELYVDDGSYFSIEELEAQKVALQEILNTLKQEKLLTDELQLKYDAINQSIQQRIASIQAYYSAESTFITLDTMDHIRQDGSTIDDPDELQDILNKRKELMGSISELALAEENPQTWMAEAEQVNASLERRIELLKQVKLGLIDIDSVDDIMNETGNLDSKLERLSSVAGDWGYQIKDNQIDDDEDATAALEEFEQVYDRIVLKLANGKNIEILPNAKGLRALYKYADGLDPNFYGESEIDDVEFVRQEIQAHQENAGAIHAEAQAQEHLNNIEKQNPPAQDDSGVHHANADAIKNETHAQEGLNNAEGQNPVANRQGIVTGGTKGTGTTPTQTVPDGATSAEVGELEAVRAKVLEVTNAVNAKTQAFAKEKTEVQQVVTSEIASLDLLEQKVLSIKGTLEELLNNIHSGAGEIGTGLGNITVTVNQGDGVGTEQKGAWALDTTAKSIKGALDAIRGDIGNVINIIDNINNKTSSVDTDNTSTTDSSSSVGKTSQTKDMGRSIESRKQYESIAKKSDQDETSRLKKIEKLEKEIGRLRADADNATNDRVIRALEQEIQFRQDLITLQKQGLAMDAQDEGYYRKRYANETKNAKEMAKHDQKDAAALLNDKVKAAQKQAGVNKAQSTVGRATDTLIQANQILGISPEQQANLDAYQSKILQLQSTIENFPRNNLATEEQKNQLIAQRFEVDAYTKEIQELIDQQERLSGANAIQTGIYMPSVLGTGHDNIEASLTKQIKALTKGRAHITGYNADTQQLTYTMKSVSGGMTQFTAEINKNNGQLTLLQGKTTQTLGVFESIGKKIKEFSYYFTGSMMIYRMISWIREGITAVKDIDSALTELKKVTDETEASYDKFLDTAAQTASKVGSTVKDVVSSTADWARLGYAIEEAHTLAESTQILMNVSEFDDVSKATDTLISAVQAFKYTADESMDVVDILNTIGNNYAISTADLAESLTKSSGSLVAANGTLEEAVALTATANTIIQDADVVGTALKTVAMRLRGTSVEEMEEEGLETDGVVSQSKLQSKIKNLSGVDILTDAGAYKSTYQILSEIADVWENINDMDQAALLELLAGKRSGSVMSAILQNPETLKDAFESASDASGSALKENEKYLDSIQGKIDLFNNSLQTMWNNEMNSDTIKWFVELGTTIIQLIDKIGLLGTALGGIAIFSMIKDKTGPIGLLTQTMRLLTDISTKIKLLGTNMNSVFSGDMSSLNDSLVQFIQAQKAVQASTLATKLNTDKLTQSQLLQKISTSGLTGEIVGLNSAQMMTALSTSNLTDEQKAQIIQSLNLEGATKAVSREQVIRALTSKGVAETDAAAIATSLGLTVATKGLSGAFKTLWASMGPVLVIMLAIAAVTGIVKLFSDINLSAEKASETLEETKNNVSSLKSELKSLESQLDEAKEKIAELVALPSLSLTQEEDLDRLQKEVELLERQMALKERQLAIEESQLIEDTETAIEEKWTKSGAYDLTNDGSIQKDRWFTWGESGKDVVNNAIDEYSKKAAYIQQAEELLKDWESGFKTIDSSLKLGLHIESEPGGSVSRDSVVEAVEKAKQEQINAAKSIETFLNDPTFTGLYYGISDKIDNFLDEYNQVQLRWEKALYGNNSKSTAIQSLFGTNATEEMKKLKAKIDEIMAGDGDWDSKNKDIMAHLSTINATADGYEHLKFVMDELDISYQNIADYFTVQNGEFNSSTISGITAQYQKGIDVMKQFKAAEDAVADRMKELQEGGSVDLLNRPQIDASKLTEAGWEDAGEGTATVFSSTYSNEDGTVAMNFTPILPDGTVLSPEALTEYAEQVIAGTREDDLNLKIGATFEGKDAISQAEDAAEEIHTLQESYYINPDSIKIGDTEYAWDELFDINDDGEFEANADKFGEILEDMDNKTRETFTNLAESVANGKMSWDEAMRSFEMSGLVASIKIVEEEFAELNKITFKNLDDEISGFIDSFSELGAALEDVAGSMDLLHEAEQQMNSSGRVSVKTALKLMESTDRWNEILTITNGTITLNSDAEDVLVESKLNVIKANIQEALTAARLQLAQLGTAESTIISAEASDVTTEAYQIYSQAMNSYSASIAGFGAAIDALINGNDVLEAFRSAYSAANTVQTYETSIKADDLKEKIASLEEQAKMIEGWDAEDFKKYYDFDETPGDKYDDDTTSKLLEKLKEKYERKISNLDNQQTYLENEIERLEAENKGVSKSYYEEQIKLEEQKMDLLQKERNELTALLNSTAEGSDAWWEVADALWEVEHAVQESTLRTIEFRESIAELYKTAFEDLDKAYGDKDDLYSDRQAYIEKYMELLELQGRGKPASAYLGLIAEEEAKLVSSIAELNDLRQVLADGMESGYIKEGDEKWVEMQSNIRETEAAILDSKVAIEQYKEELKSLKVEAFEMMRDAFSNRNDYYTNQQDYIEGYIDYLEATGVDSTPEMYEKLIAIEQEKRANNVADLADARLGLAKIEAAGYTAADEEWVDANNRIVELEKSIQDSDTAMAQWQKTIREMEFEKFDYFAERVNSLNKELNNVYKLVEDEDVAFDDGTWTEEGITALSMLYHQMENNEKMINEYGEELAKLEKQYKAGEISEKDYAERAEELQDAQWDLIHSNEDLKDSIIDINEARIDLVEEGIQDEIDAYQELIELKKEELDAERDLYDFKRNVEKQTKDIAELQRRLSAISGSDDPADIAERRQLQAQLKDAQDELNDTYYGHAKDSQSKALDDELDAYQKSAEDYIETLRETLENTEAMISQTFSDVLLNADITHQNLIEISNIYGPTLSTNLMNPWKKMSDEATRVKDQIGTDLLILNEDNIASFSANITPLLKTPFEQGGSAAEAFKTTTTTQIDEIQARIDTTTSETTREFDAMMDHATVSTNTFSGLVETKLTGAVATAKRKSLEMENALTSPWKAGVTSINTWSKAVEDSLDDAVKAWKEAAAEISKQQDIINQSYDTDKTGIKTTDGHNNNNDTVKKIGNTSGVTGTFGGTKTVNGVSYTNIDGVYYKSSDVIKSTLGGKTTYHTKKDANAYSINGSKPTSQFVKDAGVVGPRKGSVVKTPDAVIMQDEITGIYYVAWSGTGTGNTRAYWIKASSKSSAETIQKSLKSKNGWTPTANYDGYNRRYAKGTLGTKKDEWAYTDEPWLGDEIVLIPGANGNLQYMRKGTAVMPADISANLVEWGKINPDTTALANGIQGVNLMSNYVSKPELNLTFDALLKAESITEETLPAVKKLVTQELDNFARKLNYSLKRTGGI